MSFCALPFIAREYETVPCRVPLSLGRLVAAGVCALLCGVNCVYLLTSVDTLAVPAVIATPAILALLAGVAYFALHFLGERYTSARVLCGYGFLLGCVLLLSITYFDRYTPMNAPHKVGTHVALLAMAASTLYELRATLSPRPSRALSVTSLLALALTASVGVSGVIAYLAGIYENTTYLVQDLLITGFALWIGTRVLAGAESEEPQ